MASLIIIGVLLLFHRRTKAFAIDPSERAYGSCRELSLPVFATANTAVYDIPRVDNDLEATAWAIYDATRSTPHNASNIIKNTTISTTFNIHAQLCVPKSSAKRDILQIATHGVHYDSRYWDSKFEPEHHSYVNAALKAGYSILTYDRLGVGQSDILDAYTVVQAPVEQEILRQITLMARNGTLYDIFSQTYSSASAFKDLAPPRKLVHIGHSFGSFLTSAFIANYGTLSDAAIITGYILTQHLGSAGSTSFSVEYAATAHPSYERPSGYVVCTKTGIQNIFFAGNLSTAYTPAMLEYGNAIKQPVPIGEFASAYTLLGNRGRDFKGPIQYMLPEFDFYVCRGDCKGLANRTMLDETHPGNTGIQIDIQPNTGHALPLHNNATAGFQVTFDFLEKYGL